MNSAEYGGRYNACLLSGTQLHGIYDVDMAISIRRLSVQRELSCRPHDWGAGVSKQNPCKCCCPRMLRAAACDSSSQLLPWRVPPSSPCKSTDLWSHSECSQCCRAGLLDAVFGWR